MCAVNLKLDQLEAELQDLNSQESKDEASLAKVAFFLLYFPSLCFIVFMAEICFFQIFVLILNFHSSFSATAVMLAVQSRYSFFYMNTNQRYKNKEKVCPI